MNEAKTEAQAELLYNRLVKRQRHLRKWAGRTGTDAYRLYDRDIPEIPLVLDFWDGAVSGALYKRPYEKDEDEERLWLEAMAASVSSALNIPPDSVFLKQRRRLRWRQQGRAQYEKLGERNVWREVTEGGLRFRVNLSDYLDTGLFLDARKRRSLFRNEAAGKRVLNLFAYTCSFSVYAASGGAQAVDSVDLSNTYLEWGAVNFALNGFRTGMGAPFRSSACANNLIRADVLEFAGEAAKKRLTWDLIVLDPPSFSNSKKMRASLDICRDYRELISRCLSLLSPAGKLWFSSNARNFRLDEVEFPGFMVKDMAAEVVDEDFKGKKVPACFTFIRGGCSKTPVLGTASLDLGKK
jgi:23S rRNA G2069 N7-methylase RlmK/C1962 C5-methylase RlmI